MSSARKMPGKKGRSGSPKRDAVVPVKGAEGVAADASEAEVKAAEVEATSGVAEASAPAGLDSEEQLAAARARAALEKIQRHVDRHSKIVSARERRRGAGVDPLFEPIRRHFRDFEVHKVPVPSNAMSQSVYDAEVAMLQAYVDAGYFFLEEDMVSRTGAYGTCALADYDTRDGRVTIGGHYALMANRDLVRKVREANIEKGSENRRTLLTEEGSGAYNKPGGANVRYESRFEDMDLMLPKAKEE